MSVYIPTIGEVVLLHQLKTARFNGVLATIEGIEGQRVIVRPVPNGEKLLVKPTNIHDCGEEEDVEEEEKDDNEMEVEGKEGTRANGNDDDYDNDNCGDYEGVGDENDDDEAFFRTSSSQGHSIEIDCSALMDDGLVNASNLLGTVMAMATMAAANEALQHEEWAARIDGANRECRRSIAANARNWRAFQILGDLCFYTGLLDEAVVAYHSLLEIVELFQEPSSSSSLLSPSSLSAGAPGVPPPLPHASTSPQSPSKTVTTPTGNDRSAWGFLKSKTLVQMALAMGKMGKTAEELDLLVKAQASAPNDVHVVAGIGALHMDAGNLERAMECYSSALKIDSRWALGRFHMARALVSAPDDSPPSLASSTAALAELRLAVTRCKLKRSDESAERAAKSFMMIAKMLETIVAERAGSQDAATDLLLLSTRALLRGLEVLRRAEPEINPLPGVEGGYKSAERSELASLIYFQLGQILEKQAAGAAAAALIPSSSSSSSCTSGMVTSFDGAVGAYKAAWKLSPTDSTCALAVGNVLRVKAHATRNKDDLAQSIAVYKTAIEVDRSNPHLYRNLGCALMQKGDLAPAIAALKSSLDVSVRIDLSRGGSSTSSSLVEDPWREQVTNIILSLTEKLRQHREGTFVVDIPRKVG